VISYGASLVVILVHAATLKRSRFHLAVKLIFRLLGSWLLLLLVLLALSERVLSLLSHLTHLLVDLEILLFKLRDFVTQLKDSLAPLSDFSSALLRSRVVGDARLALQTVQLLLEVVVVLQQSHVLLHDLLVALLEGLVRLGQLTRHIVQRLLEVGAQLGGLSVQVLIRVPALAVFSFAFALADAGLLIVDPFLVHAHDGLLQVFVVLDLLQGRVDVVLVRGDFVSLLLDRLVEVALLRLQTFHLQLQVLHDQLKVDLNAREVDHFLLHLGGLLLQGSGSLGVWLDVLLQFFDLVVKHEFELFKLLGFLDEVGDSG